MRWMTYNEAAAWEPEARRLKVSKVARSKRGFMRKYEQARSPKAMWELPVEGRGGENWGQRRRGFIKRVLKQYKANPTYRRWLSLVMWAYWPGQPPADG